MSKSKADEIRAQAERDRIETEIEIKIAERVPDDVYMVYGHYVHSEAKSGLVGAVKFGDNFQKPAAWERAVELVQELPAIGAAFVDGGDCSLYPASFAHGAPETLTERWRKVSDIAPVRGEIAYHSMQAMLTIEWFTCLEDLGIVEVQVDVGHVPESIAQTSPIVVRDRRPNREGEVLSAESRFVAARGIESIGHEGKPVAKLEPEIRWASGNQKTPGRILVKWSCVGDQVPAIAGQAIVRQLAALAMGKS